MYAPKPWAFNHQIFRSIRDSTQTVEPLQYRSSEKSRSKSRLGAVEYRPHRRRYASAQIVYRRPHLRPSYGLRWTCPVSVDSFPSSLLIDLCLAFASLDLTPQGGLTPQAAEALGS
jgi:hypothetical protein